MCWVISWVTLINVTHEITQHISRKLLRVDVLTSETCWALSKEIIKQVTTSWSLFTQPYQIKTLFKYKTQSCKIKMAPLLLSLRGKHSERTDKSPLSAYWVGNYRVIVHLTSCSFYSITTAHLAKCYHAWWSTSRQWQTVIARQNKDLADSKLALSPLAFYYP